MYIIKLVTLDKDWQSNLLSNLQKPSSRNWKEDESRKVNKCAVTLSDLYKCITVQGALGEQTMN